MSYRVAEDQRLKEEDKTRPRKQTLAEKYAAERPLHPKPTPKVSGSFSFSRKDLVDTSLDTKQRNHPKYTKIDNVPVRKKAAKESHKTITAKIKKMLGIL